MTVRVPNLGVVAARGVFWTGGGQITRQVIQVCTSIALARLLAPDDFGLLGMALVFTGFAQLFLDFGIGTAIVQARALDSKALSSCFWTNLAVTLGTVGVLAASSPLIAAFYDRPDLTLLILVLALSLLISGSGVVSSAILSRDMKFDKVAKAQVLGTLAGSSVAVSCAWAGMGVWSLVAQQLAGFSALTFLLLRYAGWYPRLEYSWESIRGMVHFGAGVLGTNLLNFANRNTDSLLIGKVLGSGALGYYSLAYQLMLYPLGQVSGVIVRVLFPTLSRLQDEMERFRNAYLKAVSAIALVTFPMMAGLYAVSEDFVLVVFGEKWLPMLPVLQILCWVGMIQSIGATVGLIYVSLGRVKTLFRVTVALTPFIVASFVVGLPWGIEGVATGYAVANFALLYISLGVAFRLSGIRFADFHGAIARPFAAALVMLLFVLTVRRFLPTDGSELLRLVACVSVGVVTYLATTFLVNRQHCIELIALTRSAIPPRH